MDTNVPRVANWPHEETHASPQCVSECVQRLQEIVRNGGLLLDDGWHIIREYKNRLSSSGQPGVGDAFLRAVLSRHRDLTWCRLVPIQEHPERGFEEFPDDSELDGFHADDRKFVAVALASGEDPPILNATDADWRDHHDELRRNGIRVEFLCPDMMERAR